MVGYYRTKVCIVGRRSKGGAVDTIINLWPRLGALDANKNYQLKKYSSLFTFDKCPIEYTTGFVYDDHKKQFMIGYSTNDNTTKFLNIDRIHVDSLFI